MVKAEIAAPAVHVDKWKRWDAGDARQHRRYILEEGCGAAVRDDRLFIEELKTGKLYDVPPLSPDAQAWVDANKDDLRGGKNWLRRRRLAQQMPGKAVLTPRSPAPWTAAGSIYAWVLQYTKQSQHINEMACFFGVPLPPQTNSVSISVWPGLEPSDGSLVMQNVLERPKGFALNRWFIHDECSHGAGQASLQSVPVEFDQPQGLWGSVRLFGARGEWWIQSYRGNPRNTGPGYARPISAGMPVLVSDPNFQFPQGRMKWTVCEFEVPAVGPGLSDGSYTCTDLGIQAVFGGLTVMQTPYDFLPVNWNGTGFWEGIGLGITCAPTSGTSISNATSNGQTQLNLSIASTSSP